MTKLLLIKHKEREMPEQPAPDLREQISQSIYNLQDGFQRTPLRDIRGEFVNFEPRIDVKNSRTRVALQLAEIEVLESTEPYSFPTAEIEILHSNRKVSM